MIFFKVARKMVHIFLILHAKRVVNRHNKTWSLTCTKAWGQIRNPKGNSKLCQKYRKQHTKLTLKTSRRPMRAHASIWSLGTLRARTTGSSACSWRPKVPPRTLFFLPLAARFEQKGQKRENGANSGLYRPNFMFRAHLSSARNADSGGYSKMPRGPRASAGPMRHHVTLAQPIRD